MQILALVLDPTNLNEPKYPDDAKKRAKAILESCRGKSIGSYSETPGIQGETSNFPLFNFQNNRIFYVIKFSVIRRHVAEYIKNRDSGVPARFDEIYLGAGASEAINSVLNLINCKIDGKKTGVMVPVPQYGLYSGIIDFASEMQKIVYYLDEDNGWALDIAELKHALDEAKKVCVPRTLVVINPGNPTGQVLTYSNIKEIIQFAYENRLFILADEVYQHNIYNENLPFHSFKKVMYEMGEPYRGMQLASFMSASKGD